MSKDDTDLSVLNCAQRKSSLEVQDNTFFKKGGARHRPHGKFYGQKYIEPFKDDIVKWFKAGMVNKSQRKGPGKMLEVVRKKYPGRLDIPAETEIRQAISVLFAKQKRGEEPTLSKTCGIHEPYCSTVLAIFE